MKEHSAPLTFWPLFWKTGALSIAIAAVMLLLTALVVAGWGYRQFRIFLVAAHTTSNALVQDLQTGWHTAPISDNGHKNILILGTDELIGRGDVPPLTDTMMIASIDFSDGTINTLPLPRDLWSSDYQTKINALYAYGLERDPENPTAFPTQVLQEMTGVPLHHTLVLSLEQLKTLIDAVGGVEITIEKGFTDPLFPREGVDVTVERDPAVLYETVTFEPGTQTLDGKRALQYIRSRHSEDEQGHDLARGERQQQVIAALLSRVTNVQKLITQPTVAGQLFSLYTTDFSQALPVPELVATSKALLPHRTTLVFRSHRLTDISDDPMHGVLDNPRPQARYQNQWVYVIADKARFQATVQNALYN